MSQLLVRNLSFLESLQQATPKKQSEIISNATEDNLRALSELSLNILNGNLKVSEDTKVKLEKHKTFLRKLSKNFMTFEKQKTSIRRKKHILKLLITPLLSALGSIVGKVISNQI